jgi:hypothetical protein
MSPRIVPSHRATFQNNHAIWQRLPPAYGFFFSGAGHSKHVVEEVDVKSISKLGFVQDSFAADI